MHSIEYSLNSFPKEAVLAHLEACDASFTPRLSTYVDLANYAVKICSYAHRVEAQLNGQLIGLVAFYPNPTQGTSFITNVSIDPRKQNSGLGQLLIRKCLSWLRSHHYRTVILEVRKQNLAAIRFYEKFGFRHNQTKELTLSMELNLHCNCEGEADNNKDRKYGENLAVCERLTPKP
jgi:ribosomal protein S18 acetylase RimI-like enzyme